MHRRAATHNIMTVYCTYSVINGMPQCASDTYVSIISCMCSTWINVYRLQLMYTYTYILQILVKLWVFNGNL